MSKSGREDDNQGSKKDKIVTERSVENKEVMISSERSVKAKEGEKYILHVANGRSCNVQHSVLETLSLN